MCNDGPTEQQLELVNAHCEEAKAQGAELRNLGWGVDLDANGLGVIASKTSKGVLESQRWEDGTISHTWTTDAQKERAPKTLRELLYAKGAIREDLPLWDYTVYGLTSLDDTATSVYLRYGRESASVTDRVTVTPDGEVTVETLGR